MVLTFLLAFLTAVSCLAQSASSGDLRGLILDASGAPVAKAQLKLSSAATGQTRTLESDIRGNFLFRSIAIGDYSLSVEAPGFAVFRIAELQVSVGQIISQRIVLRPATLTESLEVNESVDSLQNAASNSSVALGNDRIEESPAAGRNYLNFVFNAPGFNPSNGANTARSAAATRNPANDSGFVFAGMRGRNNSISIDGVDNRDETTGSNRVAIGLEMVQEVRVAGTSMSPEFGGAAGGIVNVVTHSGTNIWHGDLTSFAQNERFNARNAESQATRKPKARRYQPGTSLNGPYRRDRGFFSTPSNRHGKTPKSGATRPPILSPAPMLAHASPGASSVHATSRITPASRSTRSSPHATHLPFATPIPAAASKAMCRPERTSPTNLRAVLRASAIIPLSAIGFGSAMRESSTICAGRYRAAKRSSLQTPMAACSRSPV